MASSRSHGGALASSVISCLRFAAPLVGSDATPQKICTKEALGSIVLDANRLAQLSGAQHVNDSDPRRILAKISRLDDHMSRIAFNDITWDSEGVVAQSMEMEIQDIEERASVSLNRNFCVLLVASASSRVPQAAAEPALLWFPHTTDDTYNNNKKYLLYVTPGRIKIVKSIADLMKKMFEEIPTLRQTSATYNVWILIESTGNSKKNQPRSIPTTASAANPVGKSHLDHTVKATELEETPEHDDRRVSTEVKKARDTQPLRIRVVTKEPEEHQSMFSFSDKERVASPISTSPPSEDAKSPRSMTPQCAKPEPTDSKVCATSTSPQPALLRLNDQTSPHIRGVSSSHNYLGSRRGRRTRQSDEALGWKSLDGEFRHQNYPDAIAAPINIPPPFVSEPVTNKPRIKPVEDSFQKYSMSQFSSAHALSPPPDPSNSPMSPVEEVVPFEKQEEQCRPTIDTCATTQTNCEVGPEADSANENLALSDRSNIVKPMKKRSARDHYRNKLGARGWWELEYQTTKVLQQQSTTRAPIDTKPPVSHRIHQGKRVATQEYQVIDGLDTNGNMPNPHPSLTEAKQSNQNQMKTASNVNQQLQSEGLIGRARADPTQRHQAWRPNPEADYGEREPLTLRTRVPIIEGSDSALKNQASTARSTEQSVHSNQPVVSDARAMSPSFVEGETVAMVPILTQKTASRTSEDHAPLFTRSEREPGVGEKIYLTSSQWSSHLSSTAASKSLTKPQSPVPVTVPVLSSPRKEPQTERAMVSRFMNVGATKIDNDDEHDSVLMATMANQTGVALVETNAERSTRRLEVSDVRHSKLNRSITPEDEIKTPFNVQGRVPIRHRLTTKPKRRIPVDSSEDDTEEKFFAPISNRDGVQGDDEIQESEHRKPQEHHSQLFTVGSPSDDATQHARQRKLAELRQKKIQQLQKARDQSTAKRSAPSDPHQASNTLQCMPAPVSHALSLPRKPLETIKTQQAAAPPPTSTMGAAEAFAVTGLARVRKPSNRKLIQNAIEYTLLAGGSLEKERLAALQALAESPCDNFVVLLKSAKELKFRALYEHHIERGHVVRIFSVASSSPPVLTTDMISQFFRYNSGKKEFAPVDSREFTVKTDACALVDQLVFKKKTISRLL